MDLRWREKLRQSLSPTRMIMFTANDWEGLVREAQNVGISRVVAKSGDGVASHLLEAIRKLFHERDAP